MGELMKVGEYIGGIYQKVLPDGEYEWYLLAGKITKIVSNSKVQGYIAKSSIL